MAQADVVPEQRRAARRWPPSVRTVFFGVLLCVLVGYTEMAFELDWSTAAGRIGPGFFPRIIGILATLITLGALVNSLRTGAVDEVPLENQVGEGNLGRHPVSLSLAVLAGAFLLFTLVSLGAIIAGAVFMFGMLALLNRGRWLLNGVLSLAVPLGLYLLFQTALNAGLPEGVLPRF